MSFLRPRRGWIVVLVLIVATLASVQLFQRVLVLGTESRPPMGAPGPPP